MTIRIDRINSGKITIIFYEHQNFAGRAEFMTETFVSFCQKFGVEPRFYVGYEVELL